MLKQGALDLQVVDLPGESERLLVARVGLGVASLGGEDLGASAVTRRGVAVPFQLFVDRGGRGSRSRWGG